MYGFNPQIDTCNTKRHYQSTNISLSYKAELSTTSRSLQSYSFLCVICSEGIVFSALFASMASPLLSALGPPSLALPMDSIGKDISSQTIILEPAQKQGIDVLLLFFPGANTACEAYFPLINIVQEVCSFRLWAAILDPGEGYLTPFTVEASIDGMITRAKEQGFIPGELSISNIFIAGHSYGAVCATNIAKKRAEGFIQMGCFFYNSFDNFAQYPKPILTLAGGRDGQLKLAGPANNAGEIYRLKPEVGDFYTYAIKPVIIIPGMNHAQFSHGKPNKERGDLDADISLEQARSQTAEFIASFITVHIEGQAGTSQVAFENLRKGVKNTHKLYKTFWEAIHNQGMQAKFSQLQIAGLPELTEESVVVIKQEYLKNFVYSKPWIDIEMKRIFVQVYLSPPVDLLGIVKNIWIKMKSHDAFQSIFHKSENQLKNVSAADLNFQTFQDAVSLTPEVFRKKFFECGKKLRFIKDVVVESAQEWIVSDVIITPAQDEDGLQCVVVQSTVITTPVSDAASQFAGTHCIKVLSVAWYMEWIMLDSFR